MSISDKVKELIDELEHITTLFEDAENADEVESALEELENQSGTINTILSER